MDKKRVLLIGMDGATFTLIHPWIAEGLLPNLAGLLENGSSGPLASTIQPTTAPAWTSMMTGKNQGKHGLFDFIRRKSGSYELEVTNATHIQAPTIFDILSFLDRNIVSVNMPYTFPPRKVKGVMVSGPFAWSFSKDSVYPPEIFPEIQQIVPGYSISADYDVYSRDPLKNYQDQLIKGVEMREQLSLELMRSRPWDLMCVVFMETDEVQHTFWDCMSAQEGDINFPYKNAIRDVYQRIDQAIGKLLHEVEIQGIREDTVVVVLSDHGFGSLNWMINMNRWLADQGYLYFDEKKTGGFNRVRKQLVVHLMNSYRSFVPHQIRKKIRDFLGVKKFDQIKGEVETDLLLGAIDWSRTRAYVLGAGGNIFLNLLGREPEGIVTEDEKPVLLEELERKLLGLVDPDTGEPLVGRIYRREDLYSGRFLENAPDLVITWKNPANWGRGRYDSQAPLFQKEGFLPFSKVPLSGSHRSEGILIVNGPGVQRNKEITSARLIDVVPTILRILSIRPPEDMDGIFLADIFAEEQLNLMQQTALADQLDVFPEDFSFTEDEQDKITQRLSSLGYL